MQINRMLRASALVALLAAGPLWAQEMEQQEHHPGEGAGASASPAPAPSTPAAGMAMGQGGMMGRPKERP